MATVTALQSFVGRLSKATMGEPRRDKQGNAMELPPIKKEGESVQVVRGQNFDSNHPVVRAFPTMFGLVETLHPVEQATAAPGEKRGK